MLTRRVFQLTTGVIKSPKSGAVQLRTVGKVVATLAKSVDFP